MSGWADVDIDQQSIGSENIYEPAKKTPYFFNTHIDIIGASRIDKGFYKGDIVDYAEAEVEGGRTIYYCPVYTEGINVALGFSATHLRWVGSPWFDQTHFNLLSPSLIGFSQRLTDWFWRTQLTVNFDTSEWSGPYTSYDLLLWGRYSYCKNLGLHFGFLGETGLHMDRVYPIMGIDWQISRRWSLNLVYPVNVSIVYAISPSLSVAFAGRNFNSRFRAHRDQCFAKSLVRYTNVGLEFSLSYKTQTTTANLYGGATFAGKYRVANQKNHHADTYYLTPQAYIGAEMDVKF